MTYDSRYDMAAHRPNVLLPVPGCNCLRCNQVREARVERARLSAADPKSPPPPTTGALTPSGAGEACTGLHGHAAGCDQSTTVRATVECSGFPCQFEYDCPLHYPNRHASGTRFLGGRL